MLLLLFLLLLLLAMEGEEALVVAEARGHELVKRAQHMDLRRTDVHVLRRRARRRREGGG